MPNKTVTVERARAHIAEALKQYARCPAQDDYENGFLGALYVIGTEALGMELPEPDQPPPETAKRGIHLRVVK